MHSELITMQKLVWTVLHHILAKFLTKKLSKKACELYQVLKQLNFQDEFHTSLTLCSVCFQGFTYSLQVHQPKSVQHRMAYCFHYAYSLASVGFKFSFKKFCNCKKYQLNYHQAHTKFAQLALHTVPLHKANFP